MSELGGQGAGLSSILSSPLIQNPVLKSVYISELLGTWFDALVLRE